MPLGLTGDCMLAEQGLQDLWAILTTWADDAGALKS